MTHGSDTGQALEALRPLHMSLVEAQQQFGLVGWEFRILRAQVFRPFEMVTATMPDCVSEVDWRMSFFPFCFPSDIRDKISPAAVNLTNSQDLCFACS